MQEPMPADEADLPHTAGESSLAGMDKLSAGCGEIHIRPIDRRLIHVTISPSTSSSMSPANSLNVNVRTNCYFSAPTFLDQHY